jgi:hypothetical protein
MMKKAENLREAKQIDMYDVVADPKEGRGKEWLPDATFYDSSPIELKTGQRRLLSNGKRGAGQFSTTRNYTLGCFGSRAYAPDIHWILAYYDREQGNKFYEHWYCAPGWLDKWQAKQRYKLLRGNNTRLQDLFDKIDDTELREILIKQIHLNDPKISSTYIENNPLCVKFDGTPEGLLQAREKIGVALAA